MRTMRRSAGAVAAMLWPVLAHAQNLQGAHACHDGHALMPETAFVRERDAGLPEGVVTWCRDAPGRTSARVCLTGPYEDAGTAVRYRASYRVAGRTVLAWDAEAMPPMLPSVFTAERIDLDGDGKRELVVGVMTTESNGIGISLWRVSVIGVDARTHRTKLLDTVELQNYGDTSGFFRLPDRPGCRLLASEWKWGNDPRRGTGMYVHGRWLRWTGRAFETDPSLRRLRRRYLFGFERAHLDGPKPMRWFLRPK